MRHLIIIITFFIGLLYAQEKSGEDTKGQNKDSFVVEEINENIDELKKRKVSNHTVTKADEKKLYKLQFGDQLEIRVYGELNTRRVVRIDGEGKFSYLLVGTVEAAGKTIYELTKELNKRIKKELKHVIITITPYSFGGQHYTISGQVKKTGRKPINGQVTLLSAMAEAGGLAVGEFRNSTIDLADLQHAFVLRKGKVLDVNFINLLMHGDMSQNIKIKNQDYIYIPDSLNYNIYILGDAIFPRSYGFRNQVSLLQAIIQARGVKKTASDTVVIVRGSLQKPKLTEVYLPDLIAGKKKDILLKPNDIIYVPERGTLRLEELAKLAVRTYVTKIASDAGSYTWQKVKPGSKTTDKTIIIE